MSRDRRALLDQLFDALRQEQEAVEAFDAAAADLLGIHLTDLRCLGILERRGRLTASELAREARLTTGATTALIDRLERAGYLRRARDERDRRRVFVELTDRARAEIARIWGPLGEEGRKVTARYSDAELGLIVDYLRTSREVLRRHQDRLATLRRSRGRRAGGPRRPSGRPPSDGGVA